MSLSSWFFHESITAKIARRLCRRRQPAWEPQTDIMNDVGLVEALSRHEPKPPQPKPAVARTFRELVLALVAVLILLLAVHFGASNAQAHTFGVHVATKHFGGSDLEAFNPGIYGQLDSGPLAGLTAGTFRNSHSRQSTYVGWTWQTENRLFAVTAGAITGYTAAKVMPLVLPSVRIPLTSTYSARLAYIPKVTKEVSASGVHLTFERSF